MQQRIIAAIEATLGQKPVSWRPVNHQGCTKNERWSVTLEDGRKAFIKAAVDEMTSREVQQEWNVYSQVQAPFMPQLLRWYQAEGECPILILENLEEADWPPPWTRHKVDLVLAGLAEVATVRPPTGLPDLESHRPWLAGWHHVAADPVPFLGLKLCSPSWLEHALLALLHATDAAVLAGDALLHMDVRGDNLCFRDERALFIDWNHSCIGNPLLDVVGWLPSLHADGGPAPEEVLGEEAKDLATLVCGYWASRAGLPPVPGAPRVRPLQLRQLRVALPWVVHLLNLPPLDGMEA